MSFVPKSQVELDALVAAGNVAELRAYEADAASSVRDSRNNPINIMWHGNAVISRKKGERVALQLSQQAKQQHAADSTAKLHKLLHSAAYGVDDAAKREALSEARKLAAELLPSA